MQDSNHLKNGDWQLGVAYRRVTADKWFVGGEVREDKAPFGKPLYLDINSLDFTVDYGVSDRTRLSLTLPFSHGTHSRFYADGERHEVSAGGLGDINLMASYWMIDPSRQKSGNAELGIGIKAPTGRNDVTDDYFVPGGKRTFTVDQSIQLGDGGWGFIFQGRAFRELFRDGYGYVSGSYLISPRNQTSVVQAPAGRYSAVRVSVPDVYNMRAGLSYTAWPSRGIALSLGGRVDGIPLEDLVGESDGFRRPATLGFVEPGISLVRGTDAYSLSVPILVYANLRPSMIDRRFGFAGGGDLAEAPIFLSYQHRF